MRIVVLIIAVVAFYKWVAFPVRASGDSMIPTIQDRQVVLAWRMNRFSPALKRGDLVVINYAGERQLLLKRILGLPGERFAMRNGAIFINGEIIPEPYVQFQAGDWNRAEILLEADEYFFCGDNRSMGLANHYATTVKRDRIMGKVKR